MSDKGPSPMKVVVINDPVDSTRDAYAALALRAGFATKVFAIDDERAHRANLLTFSVLCRHLKRQESCRQFDFSVTPTSTIVSFRAAPQDIANMLAHALGEILKPVAEADFDVACAATFDYLKEEIEDADFRARLFALEYLHGTKGFSKDQLIYDMQALDYEIFQDDIARLATTGNMAVCIMGDVDSHDIEAALGSVSPGSSPMYAAASLYRHPLPDMHIKAPARTETGALALALTCTNQNIAAASRRLILDITAEQMNLKDYEICYDHYVAGLFTIGKPRRSLTSLLPGNPVASFEKAREHMTQRYAYAMKYLPDIFTMQSAEMLLAGLNIPAYIAVAQQLTAEEYAEIFDEAQVVASEGQCLLGPNFVAEPIEDDKEASHV